jgi:hypothetical protein
VFDVHIKDHINQITSGNDSLDAKVSQFDIRSLIDITKLDVAPCLLSIWRSKKLEHK